MKVLLYFSFIWSCFFLTSCRDDGQNKVVSQKYIHKYGFDLTQREWEERKQDGQVATIYKDGTKVITTYANGVLDGSMITTYPNNEIVLSEKVYDQGILLKEIINDENGIPIREEIYEFDDRKIITLWFKSGAPMSIEEYNRDLLLDASYFNCSNELEASVEDGKGTRIRRNRDGKILIEDQIDKGAVAIRKTFHQNGQLQSVTHFKDYSLHGPQKKYTISGKPLLEQKWNTGVLDGMQRQFRNGKVVCEIPYRLGEKDGMERQYDFSGALIAEIPWKNDEKHGRMRVKSEDFADLEWFFRGKSVSRDKFRELEHREKILAELSINEEK